MGKGFASQAVTRVFSSPLQRARDTAAAIAAAHDLEVELDDRLIELDYGDWDGLALTEVRTPPTGPRGASIPTSHRRAANGSRDVDRPRRRLLCRGVRRGRADDLVVAVSHVSPIKAAVCMALGVDDRVTWRMQLEVASVTRIGRRPDGTAYLSSFNDASLVSGVALP